MPTVLITGAAGNLGSLLARHLLSTTEVRLRLMIHDKPLPEDLASHQRVEWFRADLANPDTLTGHITGSDVIVHFAGVLFKARPEKFLPVTNTIYFKNLVDVALREGIQKIILISFPHVEGATTFDAPASGRLDGSPISMHATTRLEEERYLMAKIPRPVSLRVGMVYGRGILMVDVARWFARRRLLGVWKDPTQIHLISREDFCAATTAASLLPNVNGIYHLGDEGKITLQEFLDAACRQWGYARPWRMPLWMIYGAGQHV
ncbi:MAG TPA: NAD(P)-dependent oxidoreductase [Opitutaceae bacterium]|jgi:nucleoside-diphosphate-sugar epimerase|nr:NAD(P)-dependent oxidoreductase [Opitutaceae bacterium]